MKFYFFAIMLVGMMIILGAAGYEMPVTGGFMKATGLIDKTSENPTGVPDGSGFKDSEFWSRWAAIIIGLSTVGIIAGILYRSIDINLITAGLIGLLSGAIVVDYISVMVRLVSFNVTWISWTMGGLFSVLIVGFFITMIEFLRGTD